MITRLDYAGEDGKFVLAYPDKEVLSINHDKVFEYIGYSSSGNTISTNESNIIIVTDNTGVVTPTDKVVGPLNILARRTLPSFGINTQVGIDSDCRARIYNKYPLEKQLNMMDGTYEQSITELYKSDKHTMLTQNQDNIQAIQDIMDSTLSDEDKIIQIDAYTPVWILAEVPPVEER